MDYSLNGQAYTYLHNGVFLHFDKMSVERHAKISEYPIMGKHINLAIEGAKGKVITLTGRFFPDDFYYISSYISNNTGYILQGLKINGHSYSDMVLLDGKASVDTGNLYGNMTLTLIERD